MIGLIVVVLLVLASIEDAMNAIWHTRRGRSLLRKLMDYLALLLLLPLSINIALAAEAIVASRRIMEQVSLIEPSAWLAALLIKLVPFLCVVLTLMFLYLFFPHTRVHTGAALAGALFAAVFWFIVQKIYVALQLGVANYNAIYGSFATIPLMLVWLQIGWTFILLGAVLAHAVQHHRHYRPRGAVLSPQRRLQTALEVLQAVCGLRPTPAHPPGRTRRSHPGHRPGGDRDRGPTARPRRSARPSRGQWRGDADAGDAGGKPARGRARPAGAR